MNNTYVALAAIILVVLLVAGVGLLTKRRPKNLNRQYYDEKWKVLEAQCADKATWPLAVIDADKLLDEALKKLHYKGKTMGERLVAAQRDIKNNDDVWYGHKLRNRLVHEADVKLKQRDVKDALLGIRAALKDLGAL